MSREPTLADIGRYESRCGYGASLRREQLPATRTSTFPPRRRVVVVVAVSIPFYFLLIPPPSRVHRATTTPPPSALFIFFPLFPSLPFLFPFLSHARAVRGRLTLGEDERPSRDPSFSRFFSFFFYHGFKIVVVERGRSEIDRFERSDRVGGSVKMVPGDSSARCNVCT